MVDQSTKSRLLRGAKVLGDFWRGGERCASGWNSDCPDELEKRSKFCKANMKWIELAIEEAREIGDGEEYGIILGMRASELEASGLTLEIEHPEHGRIKIGPKGTLSIAEISKLVTAPDAVGGVLKLLKVFPGAKVTETKEPEAKAPEQKAPEEKTAKKK